MAALKLTPSEKDELAMRRMERVLYQRANGCDDTVYVEQNELLEFDGELIGVYTLSHFARVKAEPKQATLRVVEVV